MNPREARALGIDVGSTTTKLCAVDGQGRRAWQAIEPTEPRIQEQARRMLAGALAAGVPPGLSLLATGYGRKLVPEARTALTEIGCHARGVHRELGRGGTLIDIGGQDTKVIAVGDDGKVQNFAMNDKCAAGTGRFLEVTAARLRVPLDQMAALALSAQEEVSISSTCTVFAESEIVSLIARGTEVPAIVRGLLRALVRRVGALARATGLRPPLMLSGGVARNEAVQRLLAEELGLSVTLPGEPQLMGAYGAALFALELQSQPPSGQSGMSSA
ncbi:MAG: 2-hydroxyglutaryl-CoA dehydratase [Myxococcales bacterium]|nr:2-hydroxyglutaryl-CoA dehydratase [Myxococcales bacterium]